MVLTPYFAGSNALASVSQVPVTLASHAVANGDCILAWVTWNAGTITSLTDDTGNVYQAVGNAVSQPTGAQQGQWYVSLNAKPLTVAQKVYVNRSTASGQAGIDVYGCPGIKTASALDATPAATIGTSTAPSISSGTLTSANQIVCAGATYQHIGGAIAWAAPFSGGVTATAQQGTGPYGVSSVLAVSSIASVTATGTIVSAAWGMSLISLQAAGGPPVAAPGFSLIGATVNPSAYNTTGDYVAAANTWDGYTGTLNALTAQKWYLGEGQNPATVPSQVVALANQGCAILLCAKPSRTFSSSEDAAFRACVQAFYTLLGAKLKVVLWQECNGQTYFSGPASYAAYFNRYQPIVKSVNASIPVVFDGSLSAPGDKTNATQFLSFLKALTNPKPNEVMADFYYPGWGAGTRLEGTDATGADIQAYCDANNMPMGIGEYGGSAGGNPPTLTQWNNYTDYFVSFFGARPPAGKFNTWILYFNGPPSQVNNDLTGPTDFKIPGIFKIDQNLNVNNKTVSTVTVTNPGTQQSITGTSGTLQMQGADSNNLPLTWSGTGLPPGKSISASGLISGTATTTGVYNPQITATDTSGYSASVTFEWDVNPSQVAITNPGPQTDTVGDVVSLQIAASDTLGGATFTYTAAGLPSGLQIDSATGLISGTCNNAESDLVSVTVTDNLANSSTITFTWTVNPPPNILAMSIAPQSGTDQFGNFYPAGAVFGVSGAGQTFIDLGGTVQLAGPSGSRLIRLNPGKERILIYDDPAGPGTLVISLAVNSGTDNFGNNYPAGLFWNSPWINMPALTSAGWSVGGHARYRLDSIGNLQVSFKDIIPGTATIDGTVIWAAGSLPAAYAPNDNHRVVAYCNELRILSGSNNEGCALEFGTDGSIACYGVAAAATRIDLYATIPLN